ncbi:MAG: hypothetical protein KA184_14275 [Candidatus Hydrogenedentes bacterium]|nr:hypothetical protein [Candidatus Hydrogenedentota bacterium]
MLITDAMNASAPLPDKSGARAARNAGATARGADTDGVVISADALAAAERARFEVLAGQGDIRQELVAQAKEELARGAHRIQQVVVEVARKMFPLVTP